MESKHLDFTALYFSLIERYVPRKHWPYLFLPEWHCPKWHEYSLMKHIFQTIESAFRIRILTGVDVMEAAALHDVGKIRQFKNRMETGDDQFIMHELCSTDIIQEMRLPISQEDIFLVRNHDISYQTGTEKIWYNFCQKRADLLTRLIAIATADTVAKGWSTSQKIQRTQVVASKMARLCEMGGLDLGFRKVIQEAVIQW